MTNAYIKAYCVQNLGDDMFVRSLLRKYPNIVFTSNIAPCYNQAVCEEPNIKLPGKVNFFLQRVCNKLKILPTKSYEKRLVAKNDVLVKIGGSIFMERPGDQGKAWDLEHKNVFVIGANFGPWQTDSFLEEARLYFSQCRDVCFREQYSYALFDTVSQVRVAPDVLFGYPDYPSIQKGHSVGISVISLKNRPKLDAFAETYCNTIAGVCDRLIEENIPVKLFSFCTAEGDMDAIHTIVSKAEYGEKIAICAYNGDIDKVLNEMNTCETIIATRFHAMILGWSLQKKVLPVIYSQKQTHVIEDVSWDGYRWDLLSGETPTPVQIVQACADLKPLENISELSENAQKQFEKLDIFLNGGTSNTRKYTE